MCELKKIPIHLALSELIKSKRKKNLLDLAGKIQFHDGYNYKLMRGSDADRYLCLDLTLLKNLR